MPPTILLARGVRFRQVFVDQRFGRLHEACADGSSSAARMVSHSATSRPRILMSLSSAGQSRSPAGSSSNCSSSHSTCSRPPQMRASVMLTRSRRHVRRLTVLLIAYVSSPGHGAAAVVRKRYGDMRHHPVWRSAVPMVLVRFEKDAVARVDDLDRTTFALAEPDPLGYPDRLAVRMRVPGCSSAGREMDGDCPEGRSIGDCVDEHRAGEPVPRASEGVDAVTCDFHVR